MHNVIRIFTGFLVFGVTIMLMNPPTAQAALPLTNYLGSVCEIDATNQTVTIITEKLWRFSSWVECIYELKAMAPNEDALLGLSVGDVVEAAAFGNEGDVGERWLTICTLVSQTNPVLVDLYGDPWYRLSEIAGNIVINYVNSPDCSMCGCRNCTAMSSSVSISEASGESSTYNLLPGESCRFRTSEHIVDLTFHEGEAIAYPDCSDEPCCGVQAVSNFSVHIEPGDPSMSYSRWIEIAAHLEGILESQWRTDVVARNIGSDLASVRLILHMDGNEYELSYSIETGAQMVFEDIVGLMGIEGKGILEVQSDLPLAVFSRIYNQTNEGSFGQAFESHEQRNGLNAGDTAWLYGLRQLQDAFRSNLSASNTGSDAAELVITLFDRNGTELHAFGLVVAATTLHQELEPFMERAGRPNLGWGFASIKVLSGSGILTSASVVDNGTGDPTTIPMWR